MRLCFREDLAEEVRGRYRPMQAIPAFLSVIRAAEAWG